MEPKTTAISVDKWHPLQVEWVVNEPFVRQRDGSFKQVEEPKVLLVATGGRFLTDDIRRVPLVGLSPRTALNLLAWLENERETLEQLAQEEMIET